MDVFLGFIAAFGFNFPPQGWALCNGQLLQISTNTALFALLGTTFGGDGRTTFGLPDLRGRAAIGMGQGVGLADYPIGQVSGTENVTLNSTQIPAHAHQMIGSSEAQSAGGAGNSSLGSAGRGTGTNIYAPGATNQVPMASMTTPVGGSQPHSNMQPYLVINYCIALVGIFPSRN